MIVLSTERLILRHLTLGDAPFILRLVNEPSFIENIGDRGVRDQEAAQAYITNGPIKSYAQHGHGLYLVSLRSSDEPLGIAGLIKRDTFKDVDIGYAFLPEHWSKGYAIEAAAAVLELGRRTFGLSKMIAVVSPGNARSIHLLTKLGFYFAGTATLVGEQFAVSMYEWMSPAHEP